MYILAICSGCDEKHGSCISPGICDCNVNYTGERCDIPLCIPQCASGNCTSPGTCTCNPGYTGRLCDVLDDNTTSQVPAHNVPLCPCEHGDCLDNNQCQCYEGYSGHTCNVPTCNPKCINGECILLDICKCDVN